MVLYKEWMESTLVRCMESNGDVVHGHTWKRRSSNEDDGDVVKEKIVELEKMKDDLRNAKDAATQSWLDTRPVIDELEKMQAEVATARTRVMEANAAISELQQQLEAISACIKSKKEEEKRFRAVIDDKDQSLHKAQQEMEQLKMKIDQKHGRRSKLKLVLMCKRQMLLTLQLTSEAVRLETEALHASEAQALHYINNSEKCSIMIQIPREEYEYLRREAAEQRSMAEWQISVAAEQKLAAEKSRDVAFRRLQILYPENIPKLRNATEQKARLETNHRRSSKAPVKSQNAISRRNTLQQSRSSKRDLARKRMRSSIFVRIKACFMQKTCKIL